MKSQAHEGAVVLITGCSSGIGLEAAVEFAKHGAIVYATMRNLKKKGELLEKARANNVTLHVLPLDVTKPATIKKVVRTIAKKHEQLDILVNNAGYGLYGPLSSVSAKDVRDQYNTNVFGLIEVTQQCLPIIGVGGKILHISSVVGFMGVPFMGAYCSTKFAVEGLTEAMRRELRGRGISVTAIEPGGTASNFGGSSMKTSGNKSDPLYKKAIEVREKYMEQKAEGFQDTSSRVARDIVRIASKRKPGLRYGVGIQGRFIRLMQRITPSWVLDYLFSKVV